MSQQLSSINTTQNIEQKESDIVYNMYRYKMKESGNRSD